MTTTDLVVTGLKTILTINIMISITDTSISRKDTTQNTMPSMGLEFDHTSMTLKILRMIILLTSQDIGTEGALLVTDL